jgi:dinuclear metal center YbgI/SA1388 family protein
MVSVTELERFCNGLLDVSAFQDYCPNGLQVDGGGRDIKRLVTGVTASQALIDSALELEADLILVHHGFFWKGEAAPLTGIKGRRVRSLMRAGVSLMAYHLPLDAHPRLGNNYQLGVLLGIADAAPLVGEDGLLWHGALSQPETAAELALRINRSLGRAPLHIAGGGERITRIGWCTGAAQGQIVQAAAAGLDAFISGEISEQTVHQARELGVHYFAAGHHATERYGVQALGRYLAGKYALEQRFVEIPNPV